MWIQSLGQEDPQEKEMATCASILAWEISWTEEPVGYSLWGSQRVRHNLATEHTRMCECYLKTPLYWLVWWPSHALNQFTLSEEERRENGYWVGNSLFVTHLPLDIEVVCHSLLQGTTFCQNPPP